MKTEKQKKAEAGLHPTIKKKCPKKCGVKMHFWSAVEQDGKRIEIHKCPACGDRDTITTELKK